MSKLTTQHCEACRVGAPLATKEEVAQWMPDLPKWQLAEAKGIQHLKRTFEFEDFASALRFTNEVGQLAEAEGHHPLIILEWGKVTVQWWTHKIHGLHKNDFIMAAKTDDLSL